MTGDVDFESVPFLRALSPEVRQKLRPHARLRVLSEREVIFSEGQRADTYHFVLRGRVKLVAVAEHGRETILEMCGAGTTMCMAAPAVGGAYCCSGVCMEAGSEVLALPREDVLSVAGGKDDAPLVLFSELSHRTMEMCQRVTEMAAGQVEQRLARLILDLAARQGIRQGDVAVRIPIRLTRQDLADLCGTSLETAIRVMSRWTKSKLIERAGSTLVVLEPDALARLCRQPVRKARLAESPS